MRTLRASFVLRRMTSYRLVLGAALLTTVVTAALTGALASFAAGALPEAVHRQIVTAPDTSILVNGALDAALARSDGRAIVGSMRGAFGSVPISIDSAQWSDPLGLLGLLGQSGQSGLPGRSGRSDGRLTPLIAAAAPEHIRAAVSLIAGTWPGRPATGQPVPAAVPATVARLLRLRPGQILLLRDRDTGSRLRLRLTGIFRPREPVSPYWGINLIAPTGVSVQDSFATYGPLIVDPAAFAGDDLAVGQASWVVMPRTARLASGDLAALAARTGDAETFLQQSPQLNGLTVSTSLPQLLSGTARSVEVARSLLAIGALQLGLLAAAALALAASLLASQRDGESALLSARGGTRWQLARLSGAEAVLLAGLAVIAGALLGTRLARALLNSGPLRAAGLRLPGIPAVAWLAAGLIGLLCVALMLRPALRPPEPGPARARRGRRSAVTGVARTGADVALVIVAVIAVWQLRRYSAVAPGAGGGFGVDPVLTAAPVLALAGGTVILVRLLPAMSRIADRLAARRRNLGVAMASWEISRRPVRQGACVLLVVLAVATSTLALAQHQTWRRSVEDQASFTVGADARVQEPVPVQPAQAGAIVHAAGVLDAMPVARIESAQGQVLALDARRAAATVLLRRDLSPLGADQLWSRISPAAPTGLAVPGRPARLEMTASLGRSAAGLGPVLADVIIRDAAGVSYALPAGSLPGDGRDHRLIVTISPDGAAAYPVRLTGLTLSYTLPAKELPAAAVLTISGIAGAALTSGPFPAPFAAGRALGGWTPELSAPGLIQAITDKSAGAPRAGPQSISGWQPAGQAGEALTFYPGFGELADPGARPNPIPGAVTLSKAPASPIPAVATRGFLAANDMAVGQTLAVTFGGASVAVRIVAGISAFPTVTGPGGAVIVDLAAAQDVLTSEAADVVPVSQWWLRTRSAALPRMPPGTVVTGREQTADALFANPMSAVPQQALVAIVLAAIVLAALGFSVSVTASVQERRAQSALLAALGVSRMAQARLLCLEELMLGLPAAAAGVLLGAAVARLLVRSVTITATAAPPVPPVLIQLPLGLAGALAVLIAAVPVLAAALTVARRPDPAVQLRAAEAA